MLDVPIPRSPTGRTRLTQIHQTLPTGTTKLRGRHGGTHKISHARQCFVLGLGVQQVFGSYHQVVDTLPVHVLQGPFHGLDVPIIPQLHGLNKHGIGRFVKQALVGILGGRPVKGVVKFGHGRPVATKGHVATVPDHVQKFNLAKCAHQQG